MDISGESPYRGDGEDGNHRRDCIRQDLKWIVHRYWSPVLVLEYMKRRVEHGVEMNTAV